MKIVLRVLLIIGVVFLLGRKLYKSPETKSLKNIHGVHKGGDFEQASVLLEQHVETFPNSTYGWSFLGTVSVQLYNNEKAELAFKEAFKLDPKNDKAIVGLGVIARNKGNHILAKEMYEKALKVNPRNPDAYSSLLMLEIFNKNYSKAVELGEKAKMLNIAENKPGLIANLIIAYHLNDQPKERNKEFAELEKTNYREKEYIKMIIDGKIDVEQIFKK
jgi:Flp pilus assembly protein TadD